MGERVCVICLPGIVAITAANVKQALQMCLFGVWTCRRRDIAADERLRWESEDAKIRRHCCVWVSGTASWEQREESEKAVREERERESQRAREKPVAAKRCPTEDAYLHALEDHNTHRSHLTKLAEKKRGEAPQQQASAKQSGEKWLRPERNTWAPADGGNRGPYSEDQFVNSRGSSLGWWQNAACLQLTVGSRKFKGPNSSVWRVFWYCASLLLVTCER